MPKRKLRFVALGTWMVLAVAQSSVHASELPSLGSPDLAKGAFSAGHMLLQKTIFKVNVATIDVRFDKKAQGQLAELAQGKTYSEELAGKLAPVAMATERAVVQMQFARSVSLDRWMGVVRDNLKQARSAGLVSAELERKVSDGLPKWFAALDKRGYEKGDRLVYSVAPDGLHTVVVSTGGQVLVDMTDADPGVRRVVLASYFAPGSDFREPLLRSLVQDAR